jgi:hypothetical protein
MAINVQFLEKEGLTETEMGRVIDYMESAGDIDTTATVIHLNGRFLLVCRTAALALQTVRPDVMDLPETEDAWIWSNFFQLKNELIAKLDKGDPMPPPHTLLGRAFELFTAEQTNECC